MKKLNFILGLLFCAGIGFSMAQGTATGGTTTKAKPAVPQPGRASINPKRVAQKPARTTQAPIKAPTKPVFAPGGGKQ